MLRDRHTRECRRLAARAAFSLAMAMLLAAPAAAVPTLRTLRGALGGGGETIQTDLSADGSVVAFGQSGANKVGFVRTPTWGTIQLEDCPQQGDTSNARGVSGDGSTAVGVSVCFDGGAFEAIRTLSLAEPDFDLGSETNNLAFGVARMGDLPGGAIDSHATAASFQGDVIVGWSNSGTSGLFMGRDEAFRWTNPDPVDDPAGFGAMVGLGFLPGDNMSRAHGVSADGRSIVGFSRDIPAAPPSSFPRATLWEVDASGAVLLVTGLGDIIGSDPLAVISTAWAVSADGTTVVGEAQSTPGSPTLEAFLWTAVGGMIGLGDLPGGKFQSRALDVAGNGSLVVGGGATQAGSRAFVWTSATGMLDLHEVLAAQTVIDADGGAPIDLGSWSFAEANSISEDGLSIGGTGIGPLGINQGWVIHQFSLPDPATDCSEGTEADGDGSCASTDNCPSIFNPQQNDADGDGIGDPCDACPADNPNDSDGDGVCNSVDICPGGNDSLDADGDSVPDACDICPAGNDALDTDGDSVPDACDICPLDNPDDSDGDGICDSAEVCSDGIDNDGDGLVDYPSDPDCSGPSGDTETAPPAPTCGLFCAEVTGSDRLRSTGQTASTAAFSLSLDLQDGGFSAVDSSGETYSGTYQERGRGRRTLDLSFDPNSLAAFLATVEQRASTAWGTPASIQLSRSPVVRVKINRRRTRAKLKAKFWLESSSGGSTNPGSYVLRLGGPAIGG